MGACQYDLAFVVINFFYGDGAIYPHSFDIERFFTFDIGTVVGSLNKTGYAYIPMNCEKKKCNVHMALHGCGQSVGLIGT